MTFRLIRKGMLGDVISLEPVARALYQKFGQKVVVDCGDFAPVFKHHPGIKFGSSLSNDTDLRPGFGMDKNFSANFRLTTTP